MPRTPAWIVTDASTGQTLLEHEANGSRPAASLNRLMVLLLSLEQAALGDLPLQAPVTASAAFAPPNLARESWRRTPAAGASGLRIHLQSGEQYLLGDLLKALVVTSADDVALAVAESIVGSVASCLQLMNARAARLGMTATNYASLGGVRPGAAASGDTSSARDLAVLAQALVRQPSLLQWASLTGLPFHDGSVLLRNTNQLLGNVQGVDGLQIASSPAEGYGIVATAQRDGLRLIAVVLGAPTSESRYRVAADVIEQGFAMYERVEVVRKGERVNLSVRVANGSLNQFNPVAGNTLSLLRRRGEELQLRVHYQVPTVLSAPLRRREPVGELVVSQNEAVIAVIPLLSPADIQANGVLSASN